jgi:hypothetical protein
MDPIVSDALEGLRAAGWTVELEPEPRPLPAALAERYPSIPPLFEQFATHVRRCERGDETVWILTASDYSEPPAADGFGWDAFETMMLDPGPHNDVVDRFRTSSFWHWHLPILQAVEGDYEYLAIDTRSGAVVWGVVVDFDNPLQIAPDVAGFFRQLAEVGAAEPRKALAGRNDLARFIHVAIADEGPQPPGGGLASILGWFRR